MLFLKLLNLTFIIKFLKIIFFFFNFFYAIKRKTLYGRSSFYTLNEIFFLFIQNVSKSVKSFKNHRDAYLYSKRPKLPQDVFYWWRISKWPSSCCNFTTTVDHTCRRSEEESWEWPLLAMYLLSTADLSFLQRYRYHSVTVPWPIRPAFVTSSSSIRYLIV